MSKSRWYQLRMMGRVAAVLPFLGIWQVMIINGLPAPMSISETATIIDVSEFLLPVVLGVFVNLKMAQN